MWTLPRLDTHHAGARECQPRSLGDLTPIPRSFSGTPTSRQRHRGMQVFFALAAYPCFVRQSWHVCVCGCVCFSPPWRVQLCVGLIFFLRTCLLVCCLWVYLNGYLQLDGPNLSYRHYLLVLSCFCLLLFHSYSTYLGYLHISFTYAHFISIWLSPYCNSASSTLSFNLDLSLSLHLFYSDFFLADLLLSLSLSVCFFTCSYLLPSFNLLGTGMFSIFLLASCLMQNIRIVSLVFFPDWIFASLTWWMSLSCRLQTACRLQT